jgi:hypothetical protein
MDKEKIEEIKESFLTKLLSGDAKESSKRALAIYVVIVLGTIITIYALWKEVDYVFLLMTWLGFAATLLGLSEYNKNRTKKHDASVEIEKIKATAPKEEIPPNDEEII